MGRGKIFANFAKFVETPIPLDLNIRAGGNDQQIDINLNVSRLNAVPGSVSVADIGNLGGDRTPIDPGLKPQTVDEWTAGIEYFYNGLGYPNATTYPGLILPRNLVEPATPFYLGRHYGAVFLLLPAPYNWDLHSFTLSTLANFSDRSLISRFDYSLTLLTHLRFEAFVAVHYGKRTGEFRFAIPELERAPALLDLGVALRVAL